MSNNDTVNDSSYDWDNGTEMDDTVEDMGKDRTDKRMNRKRKTKRRLDDHIEAKRLRSKERYLDSYDDYEYQ